MRFTFALLLLPAAALSQSLRIGVIADPTRPDFLRGIRFGVEEAKHAAKLLEGGRCGRPAGAPCWRDVRMVDLFANPDTGVHAVITGAPFHTAAARDAEAPVVALTRALSADALVLEPDSTLLDSMARVQPSIPGRARRAVAWHHDLQRYGAAQLNDRYRKWSGSAMSADAWLGWFAVKLVWEGASRVTDPAHLRDWIIDPARRFDGHKGARLRFEAGRLVQPLYVVEQDSAGSWVLVRESR